MAQFDVYETRASGTLVIDCQSELLDDIDTRFVIPLLSPKQAGWSFPRLAPFLIFKGQEYVLATPLAAGVSKSEFVGPIGSLEAHRQTIIGAVDAMITGI